MTTVLVVSSVHPPDDPRIREKLIRTLTPEFEIHYACSLPGPTDTEGIEWIPLEGSRSKRRRAARQLLRSLEYDIAVIHDPELMPGAMSAASKGRTVVFDVHENLLAQIRSRESIPKWLRPPGVWLAQRYIHRVEKRVHITLAEAGYASAFDGDFPVFENYPNLASIPIDAAAVAGGPIVYVGDITEIRGATTLVRAVGGMTNPRPVTMVGRVHPDLREALEREAQIAGVVLTLTGWLPHPDAMRTVAEASVGVSPLHDVPNYRHSLPTKVLEYLSHGVPVVASDLPGTREVVGHLGGVVLVSPGETHALALALDSVVDDPAVGAAAWASAERVLREFRWPRERVLDFYRSLAAEATPENEA